jgi:hypothetical protein
MAAIWLSSVDYIIILHYYIILLHYNITLYYSLHIGGFTKPIIFSFFITSFVRHLEYYNLYFIKCNGSIYLFQVGSIRYTGWRLTRRVGIFFLISDFISNNGMWFQFIKWQQSDYLVLITLLYYIIILYYYIILLHYIIHCTLVDLQSQFILLNTIQPWYFIWLIDWLVDCLLLNFQLTILPTVLRARTVNYIEMIIIRKARPWTIVGNVFGKYQASWML